MFDRRRLRGSTMKGFVAALTAVVSALPLAAPAAAADLPVMPIKAPLPAAAVPPPSPWVWTFDEDFRYFSWRANIGYSHLPLFPGQLPPGPGSGSQIYVPMALKVIGKPTPDWKVTFLVRSGYVSARQTTPGASGEVSTTTDTMLNAKAAFLGWNGIQPFATLSVNVPTGKSALLGTSAFARLDPDLVDLATYGEGLNIGPTGGVNVPLTDDILVSAGGGYTYRGPYDREGAIDPVTLVQGLTHLKPGDQASANGTIGYDDDRLAIVLGGNYTVESTTFLDDQAFYKTGDRRRANLAVSYEWDKFWDSSATANYSHYNRNSVAMLGMPGLVPEQFNSNATVYRVDVDTTYKLGPWSAGPVGGYLFRDRNSWNSDSFQFLPAKTRWLAGGVMGYKLTPQTAINGRFEYYWISEGSNPQKIALGTALPGTAIPAVSGTGWLMSLAATVKW
jgi:hypothetical protein